MYRPLLCGCYIFFPVVLRFWLFCSIITLSITLRQIMDKSALDQACERRHQTALILGNSVSVCLTHRPVPQQSSKLVLDEILSLFARSARSYFFCLYQPIICAHSSALSCVESWWSTRCWPFWRTCRDWRPGAAQRPTNLSFTRCTSSLGAEILLKINCSYFSWGCIDTFTSINLQIIYFAAILYHINLKRHFHINIFEK